MTPRNRVWIAVAAAVLVAGVTAAVVLVTRSHPAPAARVASSPSTTATPTPAADAYAIEACREVQADIDSPETPVPETLLTMANEAARSSNPEVRSAGVKLQGTAQTAVDAGPDDLAALAPALPDELALDYACMHVGLG